MDEFGPICTFLLGLLGAQVKPRGNILRRDSEITLFKSGDYAKVLIRRASSGAEAHSEGFGMSELKLRPPKPLMKWLAFEAAGEAGGHAGEAAEVAIEVALVGEADGQGDVG